MHISHDKIWSRIWLLKQCLQFGNHSPKIQIGPCMILKIYLCSLLVFIIILNHMYIVVVVKFMHKLLIPQASVQVNYMHRCSTKLVDSS